MKARFAPSGRETGEPFYFAVFGWMVHVYPFEEDPEAVFRHPNHHQHTMP